jgi:hypothetical protein
MDDKIKRGRQGAINAPSQSNDKDKMPQHSHQYESIFLSAHKHTRSQLGFLRCGKGKVNDCPTTETDQGEVYASNTDYTTHTKFTNTEYMRYVQTKLVNTG